MYDENELLKSIIERLKRSRKEEKEMLDEETEEDEENIDENISDIGSINMDTDVYSTG